jgi:O-antigen/teichoic acid export membrane protein
VIGVSERGRHQIRAPGTGNQSTGIRSIVKRQWSDPLSRGGLALMVNTALTGVLGYGYWIVAARLFSTYAVGVAGALASATTLFAGIGQLNLSGMLMRFLPTAREKSRRLVAVSYTFAAGASALIAAISVTVVRILASPTSSLRLDATQSAVLVAAVAAAAIFTIEDSVLIGLRRAVWVPAENGAFGIAKIGLIILFAPIGTAFALYSAWMIPITLTIPVISFVLFVKFLPPKPTTRRMARLGRSFRASIFRFAIGDAAGGLFTQAWTYLLPILVTVSIGGTANALYYTSFLFSSTIDQVAVNYASSLTVEGAHSPNEIAALIRRALRHIFTIIVPAVGAIIVISPLLLRAFGDKYVRAVPLICMLLLACLPKAVSTVYYAYCRIQRTTHKSAVLQGYACIATLTVVLLVSHRFGLVGVGAAIAIVQFSASGISWWGLRGGLRIHERGQSGHGRHRRSSDRRAGSAKGLPVTGG